jgi:hypothetical protein
VVAWDETVPRTFGDIVIDLPAAVVEGGATAIDSAANTFEGEGLSVIVDRGPFADRLDSHFGRPDYREELTEKVGTVGRTIFFRDPAEHTYTVATHLPAPVFLTVVVRADESVPEGVPRHIIESIRNAP